MTKSIKEKNRLARIKEHRANNTLITADLLKIDLVFNDTSYFNKFYSRNVKKTLLKKSWLKDKLYNVFKKNLNNRLLRVAQHLEIYELKVRVNLNMHDLSVPSGTLNKKDQTLFKSEAFIIINIEDKKSKNIGFITFNENIISPKILEIYFNDDFPIPSNIFEPSIEGLENKISKLSYNLFLNNKNIQYYAFQYEYSSLSKIIKNTTYLHNDYLKFLGVDEELLTVYQIRDNIETEIYLIGGMQIKPLVFPNIELYDKIAFIKTLIALEIIKIDIPNNLFTMENIEEIESLIKLCSY